MEEVDFKKYKDVINLCWPAVLKDRIRRRGVLEECFPEDKIRRDVLDKVLEHTDVELIKQMYENREITADEVTILGEKWKKDLMISDEAVKFVFEFFSEIFGGRLNDVAEEELPSQSFKDDYDECKEYDISKYIDAFQQSLDENNYFQNSSHCFLKNNISSELVYNVHDSYTNKIIIFDSSGNNSDIWFLCDDTFLARKGTKGFFMNCDGIFSSRNIGVLYSEISKIFVNNKKIVVSKIDGSSVILYKMDRVCDNDIDDLKRIFKYMTNILQHEDITNILHEIQTENHNDECEGNINLKAKVLKEFFKANKIEMFDVQNYGDEDETTIFRSQMPIQGQLLPFAILVDRTVYTLIQVQLAPAVVSGDAFVKVAEFCNECNNRFFHFKFTISDDDDLLLYATLIFTDDNFDPVFLNEIIAEIDEFLDDEYSGLMERVFLEIR